VAKRGNGKERPHLCPICAAPATPADMPFCSARCAQVDLGRWLNEDYRIPASDEDDPADEDGEI
jgi:hypothetical protein